MTTEKGERVIKRYDNRKLYDAQTRRYVTLGDLARLVASGLVPPSQAPRGEAHVEVRRQARERRPLLPA